MIKPLNNIVIVSVNIEPELKSDSGIILKVKKEVVHDRPTNGIVKAVHKDSKLKVGDIVYFDKTSGIDFEDEGEPVLFLKEQSILGFVRPNEN